MSYSRRKFNAVLTGLLLKYILFSLRSSHYTQEQRVSSNSLLFSGLVSVSLEFVESPCVLQTIGERDWLLGLKERVIVYARSIRATVSVSG